MVLKLRHLDAEPKASGGRGRRVIRPQGGRLNKFMETVEKATGSIPVSVPIESLEEAASDKTADAEDRGDTDSPEDGPSSDNQSDAATELWSGLLQIGMKLFEQFAPAAKIGAASPRIERDERTGESFVKLPVPPPQFVEQALTAIQGLLQRFKGTS